MAILVIAEHDNAAIKPSDATMSRLAAKGIAVTPARIVDLTVAGARYDVYKGALDVLTTAPDRAMTSVSPLNGLLDLSEDAVTTPVTSVCDPAAEAAKRCSMPSRQK